MELESFSHSYGQLAYHVVLVTKYRRQVLKFKDEVKLILNEIAIENGMKLYAIEVQPDHVHIFVSIKPSMPISLALKFLKGKSSRILFKVHPEIKQQLWGGHLWSRGTFIRSVGSVTAESIERYIYESQS